MVSTQEMARFLFVILYFLLWDNWAGQAFLFPNMTIRGVSKVGSKPNPDKSYRVGLNRV